MFNSTALEVAIGVALVYLLLSLFCTAVNEVIAAILKSRAKNLERGVKSLFTQGNLTQAVSLTDAIYRHGLVQSLYRSNAGTPANTLSKDIKNPPAYIPSRTFASALYDVLFPTLANPVPAGAGSSPAPADAQSHLVAMLAAIDNIPTKSPGLQAIRTLVKEANGDVEKTRLAFEHWYDDGMDRAAGWYKKRTQRALFLIGLVGAIVLNVDTIVVARNLWSSPSARSFAVGYADKMANDTAIKETIARQKAAESASTPTTPVPPQPVVVHGANSNAHQSGSAGSQPPAKPAAPKTPAVPSPDQKKDDPKSAMDESGSSKIAAAYKDLEELKSLNLPIGWKEEALLAAWDAKTGETTWPKRFRFSLAWHAIALGWFGWFLTAIAVTLGAPFWFDTLNQFMVVRSTIKPREKSDVEGSKDSPKKS